MGLTLWILLWYGTANHQNNFTGYTLKKDCEEFKQVILNDDIYLSKNKHMTEKTREEAAYNVFRMKTAKCVAFKQIKETQG